MELNLASDVRGNEKGFYRYIRSKRKTRENVGLLLNAARDVVTKRVEGQGNQCLLPFGHRLKYRKLCLNIGKHFFTVRVV